MKAVASRILTLNRRPVALRVKLTNNRNKEVEVDIELEEVTSSKFMRYLSKVKLPHEPLIPVDEIYATRKEIESNDFVTNITTHPVLLNNVLNALLR